MGLFKLDLDSMENYVGNHLRLFISMAIGILVFVGIVALSIFFASVRGAEETMVPEVRGKELTAALMELQVKELYPRIQLRYSQSALDKGIILEQEPAAGAIVKAGRRIRLVVSQGILISRVENYIGRTVDDVRMEIQTLNAASGSAMPLLSLKEPFMYEYSSEPAGLILQQSPLPGTDISGPAVLEFSVSLGAENAMVYVPSLVNMSVGEALEAVGKTGLDFVFSVRPQEEGETALLVVRQSPAGDTEVPNNSTLGITVASPLESPDDYVFGLFRYSIPKNPYPLPVKLEALFPSGERITLGEINYAGGDFTLPYELPRDTELTLSMVGRELYRERVALGTAQE
ncbi:MAG: PASTA domain-containing protein [Treponema sp.]|jgi:beta-lactam-binding protein with PASTA domain|nr:PASTA domain-containing protein [Treponema sp.]